MRKITADYIFPIHKNPIKNGIIIVDDNGKILDVLSVNAINTTDLELHTGIICPGFVNTHCHLELSHLENKLPEHTGLDVFIRQIESQRKAEEEEISEAIKNAENEMLENGIVAVGDISNGEKSFSQKAQKNIFYHTFIEVFGFHPDRAESAFSRGLDLMEKYKNQVSNHASITPHAPYSASDLLLKKIFLDAEKNNSIQTIHNQECADENLFFEKKEGKILERLPLFGIDTDFWNAAGKNSLRSTLPKISQKNNFLLVHNTFTSREDINWANTYHPYLYWCFSPNANLYIENKLPDFENFISENARITIGTDSLASNHQLSILEELKTIAAACPEIPLQTLLTWATKNGADFLNCADSFGTIEKNKFPGLVLLKNINLEKLNLSKNTTAQMLVKGKIC
ncbi:MAG TPA: amidohydrolase family protein [Bacteroidia bacterium]|nr:amidohydrolase family protein [Bacteroidia bacterium]